MTTGLIIALSKSPKHTFTKPNEPVLRLLAGLGVEGDAHMGRTVRHRSRVAQDPAQPNLRQVHLIHQELLAELIAACFPVFPGAMGENITTSGIDLLALPKGTRLQLGDEAILEITGLRNPCNQLNQFAPGLMQAVLDKDEKGRLIRKAGVMGIVIKGGQIAAGDVIAVTLPPLPHLALDRV